MRYRFNDNYDPQKIKQLVEQTEVNGAVLIVSAIPPSDAQKGRLEQLLQKQYGITSAQIVYELDCRLIGGMRMHIGDLVIDNTISHRLMRMKEAMQNPEIISASGLFIAGDKYVKNAN